jgi:histone H2B
MVATKKRTRSGSKETSSYGIYIYKIMKQVHPDLSIGSAALQALNGVAEHVAQELVKKAAGVAKVGKSSTLTSRNVQGAARLILPSELRKHAVSDATKAVVKFQAVA